MIQSLLLFHSTTTIKYSCTIFGHSQWLAIGSPMWLASVTTNSNNNRDICPEIHIIICIPLSINITKCAITLPINFNITSGKKYGLVKVMKCPRNYNPTRDINSDTNPNLKDKPNTNTNPKDTNMWFMFRLSKTLGCLPKLSVHLIICFSRYISGLKWA